MKLLRVGGADETVSIRGVISFGFGNSITPCDAARVSCVAAVGCNETGELVLCSGELLPETSAASPSATPPKTIRPIKGKPSRCMVSSQKTANAASKFYCTSRETKRQQVGS